MALPAPTEVNLKQVTAGSPDQVAAILAEHAVAILPLTDISKKVKEARIGETKFYTTANNVLLPAYQIEEPSLEEKLNPATFKLRKAPDAPSGFGHQYATPIHHELQASPLLRETMTRLYGKDCKYAPNRLRLTSKFKFVHDSLHIEGLNIWHQDEDTGAISLLPGEVATIVGLAGQRRFVFWDLKGADLQPLWDRWHENPKVFHKIDPHWMHNNYPGRRRMVTVDCNTHPMLIMWRESAPHEIACSPSLSAFISPIGYWAAPGLVTKKGRNSLTSTVPTEYEGLTKHETNLLGICYNMPGFQWPSGKKCYSFCHQRAYCHYLGKVRSRYLVPLQTATGTRLRFQMRLIDAGKVDQKDPAYRQALERRGIKLPAVAFADATPLFVQDILKLSDTILQDYGFIPTN